MNKQKLKNYLKLGILIFGFSLITNCENNDNFILENSTIENIKDSIPINANIKSIQSSELPDAFKNELFNNFSQQKKTSSKQKKALLKTHFEPKASVVKSINGIITYALPIKNSKNFTSSLKEGIFRQKLIRQRLSKSDLCDDKDSFEVLAMNFNDSDSGSSNNGLTHISFTPGITPGTTYTTFTYPNTGIQESLPTFLNKHINSTNEAFDNSTPTNSTSTSNGTKASIFTRIWRGISWAGNGVINLFRSDKCHCPNYTGSKNSTQQKNQADNWNDVFSCCSSFGNKNASEKGNSNNLNNTNFQFYIPLPDSLFENSKNQLEKSSSDKTDCECRLGKININTANELIKQDFFDCACANDNSSNMSPLLKLDMEQTSWLEKPENKITRNAVCKFTKDNNYSEEAKEFIKPAINVLIDGIGIDSGISDFVDEEPVKNFMGTVTNFKNLLDNSPRGVGKFKGNEASDYLKSLGETKFNFKQMRPLPTQTGFFNTKKGGWIDMAHFMFYAGKAYEYKINGESNPIGEAVQDGYKQELSDSVVAKHSAYSYEDLPSDKFGAEFAVNYFTPNSNLTFGEQLANYLNNILQASEPNNAPNYDNTPDRDSRNHPTNTNKTTTPIFIQ